MASQQRLEGCDDAELQYPRCDEGEPRREFSKVSWLTDQERFAAIWRTRSEGAIRVEKGKPISVYRNWREKERENASSKPI